MENTGTDLLPSAATLDQMAVEASGAVAEINERLARLPPEVRWTFLTILAQMFVVNAMSEKPKMAEAIFADHCGRLAHEAGEKKLIKLPKGGVSKITVIVRKPNPN